MAGPDDPAVVNNTADGRFEVKLGDQTAFAEYRLLKTGIMFPHTVVPEAFEGRGIGGRLVEAAMAFARERGELVMPTCTFFAGYIKGHPEHRDLVHPGYRAALGI